MNPLHTPNARSAIFGAALLTAMLGPIGRGVVPPPLSAQAGQDTRAVERPAPEPPSARPAPEPIEDPLPPAPPPAPAAPAATQPPPPAPAQPNQRSACPLGQRRDDQGHCVNPDPDPWTEGNAPVPRSITGYHTHDGFMLRMVGGLAAGGAHTELSAFDVDVGGLGFVWGVDMGAAIAEDWVLHGRLTRVHIPSPRVELDGDEVGDSDGAELALTHLGPAITFYLMPYNLYFTASVGLAFLSLEDDTRDYDTDLGGSVQLDVGKEWWVDPDWGLGLAARLTVGSVGLDGVDAHAEVGSLALLFSATYQ